MSYARLDQYKSIKSAIRWIAECAADEFDRDDYFDNVTFRSTDLKRDIEQGDWISEFIDGECIYDDTCSDIIRNLSENWNGASSLYEYPKTIQEAAYGTLYDFILDNLMSIVQTVGVEWTR